MSNLLRGNACVQ